MYDGRKDRVTQFPQQKFNRIASDALLRSSRGNKVQEKHVHEGEDPGCDREKEEIKLD
jgi:hypothetical protein